MSLLPVLDLESRSPEQTAAFARRLGVLLGPGDTLLLEGPVGAGKSHFCRALIQSRMAALGESEDVPSPSFTLVQTYQAGPVEIWHADLYRLADPQDVVELGLDDAFAHAICLVEWPDRLGPLRPDDALQITLAPGTAPDAPADTRHICLSAAPGAWAARLSMLHSSE
ncbi:MAG: tRNA (adenosine(37)-N6)-threonylcarbamoyltransferase complex ATPase subunit type 1 TsaE [Roseinatronobacter sp.]